MRILPRQAGRGGRRRSNRRWLAAAAAALGLLLGLRLLTAPLRPALAPASRPWKAKIASLNYIGGNPATLEVQLALENASAEAVRRVQMALLLPPVLKAGVVRTTYWDPLLEGMEVDYWAPQSSRTLSFGLKLSTLGRDEAIQLLEGAALRLRWTPAEPDPRGTKLEQTLKIADLWRRSAA
ncbi:MAG: hypothetical protein M1602_03820 [Firmicutes bacterium]|nr:hypothetical protein [Bacillota bacterium]